VIWCALIFVFFSLSKNKQEYYIAPIYPGAALIIAGVLDRMIGKAQSQASHSVSTRAPGHIVWNWMYGTLSALLLLLASFMPYILSSFMPGISPVLHYGPSLVLFGGALLLMWSIARGIQVGSFFAVALSLWAIYLTCALFYLPALEGFRPVKDFCRTISARSQSGDEAGYFGTALPSMAYYLRRPIFENVDQDQLLRKFRSARRIFCVLREKDFSYFADKKDLKVYVLDRNPRFAVHLGTVLNAGYFPGDELLLVSNQP
jgi:4-amino-4-deoxy-L-arabinose transferase-like glycosyltransferase